MGGLRISGISVGASHDMHSSKLPTLPHMYDIIAYEASPFLMI